MKKHVHCKSCTQVPQHLKFSRRNALCLKTETELLVSRVIGTGPAHMVPVTALIGPLQWATKHTEIIV